MVPVDGLDGTSRTGLLADQGWIQRLLRLVRLCLRNRGQIATQRDIATRNHVEARHRCAEGLHSKVACAERSRNTGVCTPPLAYALETNGFRP